MTRDKSLSTSCILQMLVDAVTMPQIKPHGQGNFRCNFRSLCNPSHWAVSTLRCTVFIQLFLQSSAGLKEPLVPQESSCKWCILISSGTLAGNVINIVYLTGSAVKVGLSIHAWALTSHCSPHINAIGWVIFSQLRLLIGTTISFNHYYQLLSTLTRQSCYEICLHYIILLYTGGTVW